MRDYKEYVVRRLRFLDTLISRTRKSKDNRSDGCLIARRVNGTTQYYVSRNNGTSDKYIARSQSDLVREMANEEYQRKLCSAAEKERNALLTFLKKLGLSDNDVDLLRTGSESDLDGIKVGMLPEGAFEHIHPLKKDLLRVPPQFMPDDLYIAKWQSEEYDGLPFYEGSPEFYTARGERVRSKSEVIIANTLHTEGIPYKYEKPLWLNGRRIYPDFTILNPVSRKEYYWEHFGLLSDPDYHEETLNKLRRYESNGIYPGDKLLFTWESDKHPLNTNTINEIINRFLR